MIPFEWHARTRTVFGPGTLSRLGELALQLGIRRALLVADEGLVSAGHVARVTRTLETSGIAVVPFHDFGENPDSAMVEQGRAVAADAQPDGLLAVGGGSSLDCAKGINFVLTNGGTVADYRGHRETARPMLPMIGVPTTAGTGSEAQSYAVLADATTHAKIACGAPGAAFRVAVLDPELTVSAPRSVTAAAGMDALAHAVETWVTTRRTPLSDMYAGEAWRLLSANYLRALTAPDNLDVRGAMLLGAHLAGAAIEQSMLGATHACANPLTQYYGTVHGVAIALLLPAVVRWNARVVAARYAALAEAGGDRRRTETLVARLEDFVAAGEFPGSLGNAGIPEPDLPHLAEEAARQWTGQFNPRRFDAGAALEIYAAAY